MAQSVSLEGVGVRRVRGPWWKRETFAGSPASTLGLRRLRLEIKRSCDHGNQVAVSPISSSASASAPSGVFRQAIFDSSETGLLPEAFATTLPLFFSSIHCRYIPTDVTGRFYALDASTAAPALFIPQLQPSPLFAADLTAIRLDKNSLRKNDVTGLPKPLVWRDLGAFGFWPPRTGPLTGGGGGVLY